VVAILAMCAAMLIFTATEVLHARRIRKVAGLAFGTKRRPSPWVYLAAPLCILASGATTWGLVTLWEIQPKVHKGNVIPESEYRDLLLVIDVSPSMRLADAGPTGVQSRMKRAADLLKSFFERTPIERYKVTVVATFTGAKPVVERTTDREVIRNILEDLPMQYAFKPGPTELFTGIAEAARIARSWRPKSTTLVVMSDGDTIPATGMPKLPDSVAHVLVVGVGNPQAGKFIDGHQSRQDASTLRQLAVRLNGSYHDGNEKQIPTDLLKQVTAYPGKSTLEKLTKREYALIAVAVGSSILALMPLLLHFFGTRWKPGVRVNLVKKGPPVRVSRVGVPAGTV
jgi:Ca-activated chloride channel homolog